MVHTGELKNTSTVSSITGSARTTSAPIEARLARVMRPAQPTKAPTPVAVHSNITAMTTASSAMSKNTSADGPPKTAPSIAAPTATAEATPRHRAGSMRFTSQPARAAAGSTATTTNRTNHSVRVGDPSMSMVC